MGKKMRSEQVALARSRTYQLLSRAFLYPSDEGLTPSLLSEVLRHLPGASMVSSLEEPPEDLAPAYRRVFDHTLTAESPPYETQYGPAHIFMQSQELADIAGFYRAWGLEVSDQAKERVDHISVELEFMSYLALREAHAMEKGDEEKVALCQEIETKFMSEHLGRWVPVFATILEEKATNGPASVEQSGHSGSRYYASLAKTLRKFVAWDADQLGVRPQALRPLDLRPITRDPMECGSSCGLLETSGSNETVQEGGE